MVHYVFQAPWSPICHSGPYVLNFPTARWLHSIPLRGVPLDHAVGQLNQPWPEHMSLYVCYIFTFPSTNMNHYTPEGLAHFPNFVKKNVLLKHKFGWESQKGIQSLPHPKTNDYSWWLNQPLWKNITVVKMGIFPNFRGENEKNLWNHQLRWRFQCHPAISGRAN